MKKLILIDSNALVHRAFHALPPSLTSPNGMMTNAVYGFTSVLLKMLKDLKPDYVAATFDLAGPTFRHEEFEDYKAHRVKAPDELYAQIPMVKDVVKAFGIPIFEKAGFEADDLIGSLAEQAKKKKDLQVVIVTGDLDTLQLVQDDKVTVFTLRKGVTDTVTYNQDEVKKRYGLAPEQVVDFKGLKGDPSDNIPGVPGIGEKTASSLIQEFGNIEKLYEYLDKVKEKFKKPLTERLAQKLLENKDMAFFSKRLATIIRTVDIAFVAKEADWRRNLNLPELEKTLKNFGFFSLIKRIPEALGQAAETKKGKAKETTPVQLELGILETTRTAADITGAEELVGHDLKPLIKSVIEKKGIVPGKLFDTRIAAYLLNPDLRQYDLAKIYYAEFGDSNVSNADQAALRLKPVLWEKLKSADLTNVFEDIEMPLIPVLAEMELIGIAIDIPAIKKLLASSTIELARLEKKIYGLAGTEFNINSPQQLGDVLFNQLRLIGKVRKTGGGALSTAAPELEKLRDEHPIIPLVLEYRELQKLKTTYIEPFPALIGKDGRIHTTYNQAGAATGRLASQDPNLQNIPVRTELGQEFRRAFIAEKGHFLVAFDYSQLELRIVAHIANDRKMIDTFKRGEDIHTRTAAEIFGVPPDKVTKDMRRTAKVLNFGLIYGMGVLGFSRAAGVDRNTARGFIDRYFEEFSGVAAYMEAEKKKAYEHGFVQTIFGRRRPLPDIRSGMHMLKAQAERMAINHPVQGTEADLIKLAMVAINNYIHENGLGRDVKMLLQVHDELVFEIKDGAVAKAAPKIKNIMETVHTLLVPLTVDVKSGKNWQDTSILEA